MTRLCFIPILMIGLFASQLANASDDQITICAPNQSVPPFYLVNRSRVSGFTIDRINALFQQHTLENMRVRYILQPWQRCLKAIEEGSVDMLIAGYSPERATKAVYPDAMGSDLERSVFSLAQICLVKRRNAEWDWDENQLKGKKGLVLGLEPGFLVPDSDYIERTVTVWDTSQKYTLVKLGRVDAVLTVCGVMDHKTIPDDTKIHEELEVIFPPYIDSPVYTVFSREYYRQHTQKATLILETLMHSGPSL